MKAGENDNILKLRELSDKLCKQDSGECSLKIDEVKKLMTETQKEIEGVLPVRDKLTCYEKMFSKINKILNKTIK
jgi:hypothetical protein